MLLWRSTRVWYQDEVDSELVVLYAMGARLRTLEVRWTVGCYGVWQEIIAISCSWCKAAYHNKVSCFMMQQIDEPCTLGVHADVIIPPSWIIKLPQKVTNCGLIAYVGTTT